MPASSRPRSSTTRGISRRRGRWSVFRRCRSRINRVRCGSTASRAMCLAGWWKPHRGSGCRSSSTSGCSSRWGWPTRRSGGAGAVATAFDYLTFATMLANGGRVGDKRVLSRTTVTLMTSDSLGTRISVPVTPGELLLGTPGYTFGLGFASRQVPGVAGVHGLQGEFMWGGYAGTYFWADPRISGAVRSMG